MLTWRVFTEIVTFFMYKHTMLATHADINATIEQW